MAVGKFIGTGVPNLNNFYVEMQVLIGQRVVAIDGNRIRPNVGYRNDLAVIGLELHTNLDVGLAEGVPGNLANQAIVAPTVAFFGCYVNFKDISLNATFQAFFHTRNQIAGSV